MPDVTIRDEPRYSSHLIDRALDFLFTREPSRTSFGIAVGLSIEVLVTVFSPLLTATHLVDLSHVQGWQWIPLGILIAHVPTIFGYSSVRSLTNDTIEKTVTLIERGNFSESERRRKYRALIAAILRTTRFQSFAPPSPLSPP